ncbi:hypothetical protein GMES_2589 [Paraglaciecola mesophila KMM 241]|uniref:Uncharacterized protein n=1 Tax=Paraglaciecola mesophila KMM 241 TaxID=1128912 RepID=K6XW97_9ALTE|nr:hypothetical protein GMES_2589 [Paraglaciecola mesophila KMM 241]
MPERGSPTDNQNITHASLNIFVLINCFTSGFNFNHSLVISNRGMSAKFKGYKN